jgi:hypothetical protein
VDVSNRYVKIDGKRYLPKRVTIKNIDGIIHSNTIEFVEVSDKELKDIEDKREFIKQKLVEKIPPARVIEEMTKNLDVNDVRRIYCLITKHKAEIKVQEGCLGVLVDAGKRKRAYCQIVE